jgi:hypothetical protein
VLVTALAPLPPQVRTSLVRTTPIPDREHFAGQVPSMSMSQTQRKSRRASQSQDHLLTGCEGDSMVALTASVSAGAGDRYPPPHS